jgi:hypothetical protein
VAVDCHWRGRQQAPDTPRVDWANCSWTNRDQQTPRRIERAERVAEENVGELLLLNHKRLELSDWPYDFLHAHELTKHWNNYANSRRIIREVSDLMIAANKLLEGYRELLREDERLLDDLDLPDELSADFTLSRNLFSIGLEDLGVFAAGQGLEGVLHAIARRRKLIYQVKGKAERLQDADFHDLSEAFASIKLAYGIPLIGKQTMSLDFARTIRNGASRRQAATTDCPTTRPCHRERSERVWTTATVRVSRGLRSSRARNESRTTGYARASSFHRCIMQ